MGFKLGQGVGMIPSVRKLQKLEFTENITWLHVFVRSDTLYVHSDQWALLSNPLTYVFSILYMLDISYNIAVCCLHSLNLSFLAVAFTWFPS